MDRVFVVQLQNRPGALADLVRALAARGINIERVASGGHGSLAFACLQTDDFEATHRVLHGIGLEFVEGDSIVVMLRDEPGSLAAITTQLADAGINVRSMMTLGRCEGEVEVALVVDDSAKARQTLGTEAVLVG
jgi:hypothetical protein